MGKQRRCDQANRIMMAMQNVKAPPSYVEALSVAHREMRDSKPEGQEQHKRFFVKMDHIKPQDGEHWLLNRPEGPITWED